MKLAFGIVFALVALRAKEMAKTLVDLKWLFDFVCSILVRNFLLGPGLFVHTKLERQLNGGGAMIKGLFKL